MRRPLIDTRDIALGIRMHPFQLQMSRHTKDPEALEQHKGGTRQNADPRDVSEQEDAGAAEHLPVAVKGAAGTYPVQSVAISGNQLQSAAIRGNQRRNVSCAISGHQWPSVVISCNQLQSVEISGNQRRNVSCRSRSCGCKEVSSRVLRCTQWQSVLVTFRSRSRGSRDVINGNQVHSVAISAPHLPFEIAWVNCGTDKREHETTPHMPHAPVMREAIRGHRRLSEAIRDNSPDAACTVHCAGVHWVVDLHSDHHLGGGAVHAAAHSADDDSSPRHHGRTAGSDGDEPR